MTYRVRIAAVAARDIRKLPEQVSSEIVKVIDRLAECPRPSGVKKIKGIVECYRVRMGIYRIVYTVKDDILEIEIVTVGHRREVYRRLQGKLKRRTR